MAEIHEFPVRNPVESLFVEEMKEVIERYCERMTIAQFIGCMQIVTEETLKGQ